ncbi:mitochondrial intermembrane space import and assembly protein 40-B [Prorops nasuta]|uniref:mitochondrial intermembrane space import and assembly protein 40-B n=1 Tax=Prorops nasuta TaxID=863751 RepID=UPI0034CFB6C8
MSIVRKEGKDTIIFASKEDHAEPSKIKLPAVEPSPGLILASGEINWNCPCLGGMATGPCGIEFREAFSCFHYSNTDPKGDDCIEAFKTMQNCMVKYPKVYTKAADISDLEDKDKPDYLKGETAQSTNERKDVPPDNDSSK